MVRVGVGVGVVVLVVVSSAVVARVVVVFAGDGSNNCGSRFWGGETASLRLVSFDGSDDFDGMDGLNEPLLDPIPSPPQSSWTKSSMVLLLVWLRVVVVETGVEMVVVVVVRNGSGDGCGFNGTFANKVPRFKYSI